MSFDIMSEFNEAFSQVEPKKRRSRKREGSYQYDNFNLCKSKGQVFGVLLPDESGAPFRVISNMISAWIDNPFNDQGKKFELKWCDDSNYFIKGVSTLTPEQAEMNHKLKEEIDKYIKNFDTGEWRKIKTFEKVTIFYYLLSKYTPEQGNPEKYNNPDVTVMIHTSKKFLPSFQEAMRSKTDAEEDTSWIKDYFTRSLGVNPNITKIKTTRPNIGYEMNIGFDKLDKLAVTIDNEHLEKSKDIYSEYVNVRKFDMEYANQLLKILISENAKADALNGVTTIPTNEPKLPENLNVQDAK